MLSKIYEWRKDKMDEVLYEDDVKHRNLKAFGLGAIDGALSFMTVFGTVAYAGLLVTALANRKK